MKPVLLFFVFLLIATALTAQQSDTTRLSSVPASSDSVRADSTRASRDIATTINYSARDSINFSLDGKIVRLYGDARITYGQIELEAERITINYETNTLSAEGITDSTGKTVGFPIFRNGQEKYETRDMVYNFETGRARITEVITEQGGGYLHGSAVFKTEQNELLSRQNAYTTCNLEHPHFRIIASKSKAIPNDKVLVGPFYMEIADVPTPLGFAFGMFPSPRESNSGIIIPTWGSERIRGFFLKGGGYFFDISDYMKASLTGDIYSNGSYGMYLNSNYISRYKYSGTFNFSFTKNRVSEDIEDQSFRNDFRVTWSHSPKTRGTGRFSSSVNIATGTFNQYNNLGVNADPYSSRIDNTTRKLSSNISYSKSFAQSKFGFGINFRVNQDLSTKEVELPFPDISFNANNFYPFRTKSRTVPLLDNFTTRYNMVATNRITNDLGRIGGSPESPTDSIAPFTLENLKVFLKNSQGGMRHTLPVSTSFKVLRFFTLSPGLDIEERWYLKKLDWAVDSTGKKVMIKDTIDGFNRILNYGGGIGLNTRIYGTMVMRNPTSRIRAIRHIVNPSVSYSFQPDFGEEKYGYYQRLQLVNGQTVVKSRHEGFVYGSSDIGKASALGFGIGNTLEMKVQSKDDSVARKISILNNLSINSSYNFAADSFKLAPFTLSANTNVLDGKININAGALLDPYSYVLDSIVTAENGAQTVYQRRVAQYAWNNDQGLGRMQSLNLALGTNLNPKGRSKDTSTKEKIVASDMSEGQKQFFLNNPDAYVDFEIPWNLRISYSLNYVRFGYQPSRVTQSLRVSGDLSLTEKWKMTFNSGYDFESGEFTQTNLGITRDMHCWTMTLNWTPFGYYQSYAFAIRVKAPMLQGLKLDRNRSFIDNL